MEWPELGFECCLGPNSRVIRQSRASQNPVTLIVLNRVSPSFVAQQYLTDFRKAYDGLSTRITAVPKRLSKPVQDLL